MQEHTVNDIFIYNCALMLKLTNKIQNKVTLTLADLRFQMNDFDNTPRECKENVKY